MGSAGGGQTQNNKNLQNYIRRNEYITLLENELRLVNAATAQNYTDTAIRLTLAAVSNKLIEKREVRVANTTGKRRKFRTEIYIRLPRMVGGRVGNLLYGVSFQPFTLWDSYQVGWYYGQVYPTKKVRPDRVFSVRERRDQIKKLTTEPYIIDEEL